LVLWFLESLSSPALTMQPVPAKRRGIPLHARILIGLLLGATAGIVANATARGTPRLEWMIANIAQPIGQVFLRMLFMVVVPLVFTSISLGVAQLGDLRRIGRVGAKTLGFFVATTALAALLGLLLVNVVRPGEAIDSQTRSALLAKYAPQAAEKQTAAAIEGFGIHTFVAIVPRNPVDAAAKGDMLGLIFFALIFGIALTRLPAVTSLPVINVLEGVAKAVEVMIGFAMKLAPVGVFALIFSVTASFGVEVLKSLSLYVAMVLVGLLIHQFGVIGVLAKVLGGINPLTFFRRARGLMITAFSTSSSNATLPTNIRTAEYEFGVPSEIAGFVLPLGATMNMNGTALFEGMTVLFLAQVFGIELSLGSQAIVVVMAVITAIGAAGVPSGSIPLLVLVLQMVGVPGEGIALILGVDRILDMSRTVPNVTGDLLAAIVITRSERLPFVIPKEPTKEANTEAVFDERSLNNPA
jgi:dicarboxylate/amino acid:cation (Na+ or H+) symporter, DAACS family